MQTRRITQISVTSAIVAAILGFSASSAMAVTSTCLDNGTVEVCAEWSQGLEPQDLIDFRVTFNGAAGADVELLVGDPEWRLWTTLVSGGAVADFGAITLDPTVNGDDFTVKIADGAGSGAANVGSMVLDGSANPNWEGFSSMAGLTWISGDLGTLTLVESEDIPPEGGELAGLVVGLDLTGTLTAPKVTSLFNRIMGNVTENADIEIGEITAGEFHISGNLVCNAGGTVCPDITVTGRIHDGLLTVEGNVPGGSTIRIEELIEADPATGITEASFSGAGDFAGTLVLPNGLANPNTRVYMANDLSGVIDLVGGDVAGELAVYAGTATAEIKNGGVVSGDVYLSLSAPMQPNDYAGTATFVSVSATGEIGT